MRGVVAGAHEKRLRARAAAAVLLLSAALVPAGCSHSQSDLIIYNRTTVPIVVVTYGDANYVGACGSARFRWTPPLTPVSPETVPSPPPSDSVQIQLPAGYFPPPDGQGSAVRSLVVTSSGLITDSPPYVEHPDPSLPPCEGVPPA